MRAIQARAYGDPSVLSVAEVPRPDPAPDEVRIDVEPSGINFADVEQGRGRYPDPPDPP